MKLDTMTVAEAVAVMNQQDRVAADAVAACANEVAQAIELIVDKLRTGGRLIYVGAGTSGRLGVLDASECPPTFRTDPEMVQGVIAGGPDAMFRSKEGVEDDAAAGAAELDARNVAAADVVVGIAAGGTTPFVHGALARGRAAAAGTVFVSCVAAFSGEPQADVIIRAVTGPEVLTGSTRLKAGTATKLILNQLSTLAMVRLGKCYENLMVDVKASNAKLVDRATRIVCTLTGVDRPAAAELLKQSVGDVKLAVVMQWHGCDADGAAAVLDQANGRLRATRLMSSGLRVMEPGGR